jgi:hypothetical protein
VSFGQVAYSRPSWGVECRWSPSRMLGACLFTRLRAESFQGPAIGDRRAYSEQGLRELFVNFADVHVERLLMDLSGTPDDIVALFHDTYDVARMAPERPASLVEAVRADWQTILRPDGTVPCFFAALAVTGTKLIS